MEDDRKETSEKEELQSLYDAFGSYYEEVRAWGIARGISKRNDQVVEELQERSAKLFLERRDDDAKLMRDLALEFSKMSNEMFRESMRLSPRDCDDIWFQVLSYFEKQKESSKKSRRSK